MKKYLVFQRGSRRAVISHKQDRWSPESKRESFHKKGAVVVEGLANAGKTRWINRLVEEAPNMWDGKKILRINARSPISEMVEIVGTEGAKLYHKINAVAKWAKDNKYVLLIDDAHILAGRKADMLKTLIINAYSVVLTCVSVNQIPTAIRYVIFALKPQVVRLSSKVSYDGTQILIWLMVLIAVAGGAYELAAIIGGAGILSRGRGATKAS